MIIDDEPLIRTALSSAFRQDDMTVKTASCGNDALKELSDDRFDLCFIDIHLPDMNGLNIMKTLKTVSPGTRIVIMTGSEVDAAMLSSIQECASLLIAKPFDLDRVTAFATRVLAVETDHAHPADKEPFVNWLDANRRQHGRYASLHAISCALAGGQEQVERFAASVIDISAAGMGIQTDRPLDPGNILDFSGSALYGKGIVCWCRNSGAAAAWRSGVRFVEPACAPPVSG